MTGILYPESVVLAIREDLTVQFEQSGDVFCADTPMPHFVLTPMGGCRSGWPPGQRWCAVSVRQWCLVPTVHSTAKLRVNRKSCSR